MAANIHHFGLLSDILDELNAAGKDIAIFFLSYTLTPHAVYPTQLKQAVEALRYIIEEVGRSPSNVFIGGDSAGGNHVGQRPLALERLGVDEHSFPRDGHGCVTRVASAQVCGFRR